MPADVAQRRGAQQAVGCGVDQNVRVAVPQKAFFKGDPDASQDQPPPLDQPVHVVPVSDS